MLLAGCMSRLFACNVLSIGYGDHSCVSMKIELFQILIIYRISHNLYNLQMFRALNFIFIFCNQNKDIGFVAQFSAVPAFIWGSDFLFCFTKMNSRQFWPKKTGILQAGCNLCINFLYPK